MVSTRLSSVTVPNGVDYTLTVASTSNSRHHVSNTDEPMTCSYTLESLPVEILEHIFSYVGYKKVSQMRLVSRQMDSICSNILNSTFNRLQNQMMKRFQTVRGNMPRRESARRNHPLSCECDILETCSMRLQLLQMTFGKHIERKNICFFPGSILDEVYSVLHYIRTSPKLERPHKVTDELFDLSTMAMEYFKDQLEPSLPNICFSKDYIDFPASNSPSYMADPPTMRESSRSPSPPQSNMVLRKGIRKIKQGMKRYNNQLSLLRNELRTCKRKATEQAKQIAEQQKLLADTQKQTLEYANRLDENDKKNEEIARKFSTLLQELNKCKTELQYWRSKSPATPVCQTCGRAIIPIPQEDVHAFVNNPLVKSDDFQAADVEMDVDNPDFKLFDEQPLSPIHITTYQNSVPMITTPVTTRNKQDTFAAPKPIGERKRKLTNSDPKPGSSKHTGAATSHVNNAAGNANAANHTTTAAASISDVSKSDNSNKIRRVQNKIRSQKSNNNNSNSSASSSASSNNMSVKLRVK